MRTFELGKPKVISIGEGACKMGIMNFREANDLLDPTIHLYFTSPLHNHLNLNLQVNRNLGS